MKKFFTLILIVLSAFATKGQDPEFTQFYANPLYLNPAFAGTNGGPRFALNYRNQWPTVSAAFVTYMASYDQHFDGIGGGIGFQAWHDRAGDGELATTVISGIYSYHLNVSRSFTIKAGIKASGYQRSIDFDKLRFGDQIHPRWGFIYETNEPLPQGGGVYSTGMFPDFSAGIMGFTDKYYAGFAVDHITKPSQSFLGNPESILPRKYTGHIGMLLPLENVRDPKKFISPNLLYQRQKEFNQFNVGAYYINNFFVAGLWFRQTAPNSDALMALVGVKKDPFKIGYSYDLTLSDARPAAKGSHEISLIIELDPPDRRKVRKWRELKCPDF